MPNVNRRKVLELTVAGSVTAAMPVVERTPLKPSIIFLEESGTVRSNEPFVLAALRIQDATAFQQEVAKVLAQNNFRVNLKYLSTL